MGHGLAAPAKCLWHTWQGLLGLGLLIRKMGNEFPLRLAAWATHSSRRCLCWERPAWRPPASRPDFKALEGPRPQGALTQHTVPN